jgi:hypothetical protein
MDEQCVCAADDVIMRVDDGVHRSEYYLLLKLAWSRSEAATTSRVGRVDCTMPDCQHVVPDFADATATA